MKFYITDESNIIKDEKFEFFVYGGLVVDENEIKPLCKKLLSIKNSANIKNERPIKWSNVNWNNEGVLDNDLHANLKEKILEVVKESKCKIIIYLSPHDFYHERTFIGLKLKSKIDPEKQARGQEWAINAVLNKFDHYLEEDKSLGLVIADKFNDSFKTHMTKHCFGLFPHGGDCTLDRIIYPLVQIDNEYSYIHQINDVVLGAITFSMREMSHNFLPILKDNFWKSKPDDYLTIFNKGINIYPKHITTNHIREKVTKVKEKFKRLIM